MEYLVTELNESSKKEYLQCSHDSTKLPFCITEDNHARSQPPYDSELRHQLSQETDVNNTSDTSTSTEENTSLSLSSSIDCDSKSSVTEGESISPSKIPLSVKLQNMKLKLNIPNRKKRFYQEQSSEFESSLNEITHSPAKSGFEEFYQHFRDKEIEDEFMLLQKNHQDGVYVTPSLKSLQIWFGVIFVRAGLYDEGIFHFSIYFPDDYPLNIPVLRFKSKIFHPQIDELNGDVNLHGLFKSRSKSRVHIWEIISYARSCFYHLNVNNARNLMAAQLFNDDFPKFKARCRASVLDSILEYEEQRHQQQYESENPLKCALLDGELCRAVKNLLKTQRDNESNKGVILWARNQLGRVLNNISYYTSHNDVSFTQGDDEE